MTRVVVKADLPGRLGVFSIAVAAAVTTCTRVEQPSSGVVVRDSAGIRIVENVPTSDTCSVASIPDLDLGQVEGPPEYQFFRVFDAATLSDGRIAIVNQGSDQIRIFTADGQFERAFGSRGGGPGEFNDVFRLWVGAGDTLIVADYRPWRFSFFMPTGQFIRSVVPEPVYVNTPNQAEPLADGTFLIAQSSGGFPEAEGDWIERTLHVVRHAADGSTLDTLAALPHGRQGWLDMDIRFMGSPVFEARSHVAARAMRVITSYGSEYELRIFELPALDRTESGDTAARPDVDRPTALVRWEGRDLTVTAEHVAAYRQQELERYADADEHFVRRAAEASASKDRPVAERFPAHGAIRIGLGGDIWVRDYPRPMEVDPGWLVFDRDGRFECRVVLPFENTWDLYEIGSHYVLGKMTDELDVEHVHRFPIGRPRD